jgi:hypothetical protein
MTAQLYRNNAIANLDVDCDIGDTTITVETGKGDLFGSPIVGESFQIATLVNLANGDFEIVKITERTDDVFTVEREQENTTEANFPAATSRLEARLTAGMLDRVIQNLSDNPAARIAIGELSEANVGNSVAIGGQAKAHGESAVALGLFAKSYADLSFSVSGLPCIQRDWGDLQVDMGADKLSSCAVVISSPFVDLGQCVAWQASTAYKDGDVVIPTTPNAKQYLLRVEVERDFDYDTASFVQNYSATSGGTEPTWPTGDYFSVSVNSVPDGYWYCMDWQTTGQSVAIPDGMIFYPDEVGFICYNFNAVTAEPYVSIGTTAAPTTLVNNQQLTEITDDNMRHRFTGLKKGITGNINFKLVTKATGASSRFHGRFYAKGILIQKQDQA